MDSSMGTEEDKQKIKDLEEELEFYKSILIKNNSCIFNLYIKKKDGKNVWVDKLNATRSELLELDSDEEVTNWLKPVRCER
jgi:hypothetical protein|tara:strand:- start:456 stop:698 length:243 start_codon:yes stop_codon:yes gene_type:complete